MTTRSVARLPPDRQWDAKLLTSCAGVPWNKVEGASSEVNSGSLVSRPGGGAILPNPLQEAEQGVPQPSQKAAAPAASTPMFEPMTPAPTTPVGTGASSSNVDVPKPTNVSVAPNTPSDLRPPVPPMRPVGKSREEIETPKSPSKRVLSPQEQPMETTPIGSSEQAKNINWAKWDLDEAGNVKKPRGDDVAA